MSRSEEGFSIAELLVTVTVLFLVLASVYFIAGAVQASGRVTDRQTTLIRDVTTPLHEMDKVLSQNKAIENSGGFVSDAYTLTARTPVTPGTNVFYRHIFTATSDGKLTENVYRQVIGQTTQTLVRSSVLSTKNSNVSRGGAMFTYLGASGETTPAAQARSVIVNISVDTDGRNQSGQRQVFFRNR